MQSFRFTGQHADEKILSVSRMHVIALIANITLINLSALVILITPNYLSRQAIIGNLIPENILGILAVVTIGAWLFALFWAWKVWHETYLVITDRRLIKLGFHSPFTSYQASINLGDIEDAAATARSLLEVIFRSGTFYARPGPAAAHDLWFQYLPYHRDIHNYLMKMLYTLRHDPHPAETLKNFRPFIPRKTGERY